MGSYPVGWTYQQHAGTHDSRFTLGGELVKLFVCPADASVDHGAPARWGWARGSYAGNFQVFGKHLERVPDNYPVVEWRGKSYAHAEPPTCIFWYDDYSKGPAPGFARFQMPPWQGKSNLGRSFPDGTATTIIFGEKYGECNSNVNANGGNMWGRWDCADYWQGTFVAWGYNWFDGGGDRRQPPGPESKYQVAPEPSNQECLHWLAQTPHPSGMPVAFADGSVRTLGPDIAGRVWWALCTPNWDDLPGTNYTE